MTSQTLSDKRLILDNQDNESLIDGTYYSEEAVKEFIKKVKEEINVFRMFHETDDGKDYDELTKRIDNLAGKELIK